MKSDATNFGMVRYTNNLDAIRTGAARVSRSCTINWTPVKAVNVEAAISTVSAPLSPSWETSIPTDSVRREQGNMKKVRSMVTAYETKAKSAAEVKVSKTNIFVSGAKGVGFLITQLSK